jgi:hypothetical protein
MGAAASCSVASPILLKIGENLLEPVAAKVVKAALIDMKAKYPRAFGILVGAMRAESALQATKIGQIVEEGAVQLLAAYGLTTADGTPLNPALAQIVQAYTQLNVDGSFSVLDTKDALHVNQMTAVAKAS